MFWHQGEFGTGEEWVVLLRTTTGRYNDLEAHLIANHPWTNPEVAAVLLHSGSDSYLDWIRRATG